MVVDEWRAAPMDELGRAAPVRLILGSSDSAVVAMTGLVVYSTGLEFRCDILLREPLRPDQHIFPSFVPDAGPLLKLGVEFPHGGRATSLDDDPPHRSHPRGPVLRLGGSYSGGATRVVLTAWLWPLPGPGPLVLFCEWPDEGIAPTRCELDSASIVHVGRPV